MANCNKNRKQGTRAVQTSKPKKLNGHMYKQFLKSKVKKAKESDLTVQKKENLPQSQANTEPNGFNDCKTTVTNISYSHSQQEKEKLNQIEGKAEANGSDNGETTNTNISLSHPQLKTEKLSQSETNSSDDDRTTNTNVSFSHSQQKRVELLLRRVRCSDHEEIIKSSENDTQTKKRNSSSLERQCNLDISKLKEKLARHATTTFVEYWVPVRLSDVQMEQYCGSLFSNASVLCSPLKLDSVELLLDILVSNRKCCDHPYLGDWSLRTSFVQGFPQPQKLDAEIKLSNKLLLLHKILLEIRKRGLRVLILYQSLGGSGSVSTGDILDDIIHEKFGEDSFVRIGGGGGLSPEKRRAVLNTFNCKGSDKFACLMETRACIPSIRLESIDTVIFFNSDWNPMNDLRSLQRINLHSQFEQVKVFRLYSSHTVEEKFLILAKQGIAPEGNILNIKKSTCYEMLTWDATHLFERLKKLHDFATPDIDSIISDEDSFVEDVFLELSGILPNNDTSNVCKDKSLILEVEQIEGGYPRNVSLLGEVDRSSLVEEGIVKEPPHVFWIKLFEGRKFRWKYFSSQSSRIRKSVQRFEDLIGVSVGAETETASKKCRTEPRNAVCQIPPVIRRRTRRKLQSRDNKRQLTGFKRRRRLWTTPMLEKLSSMDFSSPLAPNEQEHAPSSTIVQNDHTHVTVGPSFEALSDIYSLIENSVRPLESSMEYSIGEVPLEAAASHMFGDRRQKNLQVGYNSLQIELESLQKQKTKISERREEMKLQMKLACEKEIEEIRKKYDTQLQNDEMAFVEEESAIETRYKKVYMNKLLAEALMRRDIPQDATPSLVVTKDSTEELYQLISQWPQSITERRSPEEVSGNLQTSNEMTQWLATYPTNTETSATDSHMDLLVSFGPLLQPPVALTTSQLSNPTAPLARNPQTNYVVRAPAPHLRHTWNPMHTLTPKISSPSGGIVYSPVSLRPVASNVMMPRLASRAISCSLPSPFGLPLLKY
ncbi:hypothetical protein ABFS82_10G095500 [Erythranthe guttata]|uniref:chromodomain-helicase-DNA-binding protein 2-like isoform X2 n=1 Tax=Erythranthe guttata TaxID=4155 RepID=UPI00064E048E|nr:PREDICTED: chromodomain-helicase-DNA-binding protein 2-like isoform X2 [Erythranthe guttata]|eukprot:XP_012840935.1 PREDICTED: chromodomain-helicase-DNA-binding protein 2-like isoform X2 [Erythranthe guttata]